MKNEVVELKIEEIVTEADLLLSNNQTLKAITFLRGSLKNHPDEAELYYILAKSYDDNNRLKRSIQYAEKAVEKNSQDSKYIIFLGELYLKNKQTDKVEQSIEKALKINDKDINVLFLLAKNEFYRSNYKKAFEVTNKLLNENPFHFEASRLLTKIYLEQKQSLSTIIESLEQSESINYEEEMDFDKATAYCIYRQYDQAKEIYQKLIHKNPNSPFIQPLHDLIHQERIEEKDTNKRDIERSLNVLNELTGLSEVKNTVNRIVKFIQFNQTRSMMLAIEDEVKPSYHFAFLGNPGTGKTTVARIIGDIFYSLGIIENNNVVEVDRSDLVGEYVGQTAVKTKKVIESALGGVLFIDEAYSLAPEKSGYNDFGAEAIDTLIKAMEDNRDNLVVIFAGYNDEMKRLLKLNPGLSSRINLQIHFEDYSDEELLDIAKNFATDYHYTLTSEAEKAFLFKINQEQVDEHFANARAVRNIIENALRERAYRLSDFEVKKEDLSILESVDFGVDTNQLFGNDLETLLKELYALEGLDSVKDQVRSIINYITAEKMRNQEGSYSKELLLHMAFLGNPGTGKTTIARLISKILKSIGILKKGHLVEVTRDDLVGQYIGQTGPKTLGKIKEAYGGVLFIDEAYSLAGSSESDFGHETISTLIKEMEDNREKLIVIFAGYTREMQRLFEMNSGMKSRIGYHIDFPDYTSEQLTKMFVNFAQVENFSVTSHALMKLESIFESMVINKNSHFGNGRMARQYFEKTKILQSSRIVDNNDKDFFVLREEDIPNLL